MLMCPVSLDSGMGIFFMHIFELSYENFSRPPVLGIVFCRILCGKSGMGLCRDTLVYLSLLLHIQTEGGKATYKAVGREKFLQNW